MSDRLERVQERNAAAADAKHESINSAERRSNDFCEPICIHTNQVYDSCKDRDCIRDQRVYFSVADQDLIDRSINVKVKSAEIIWVYTDVEQVPFNRGYYTVDIKYFIKVTLDVFTSVSAPTEICGLTTYDKRVILFGSEGNAKIFQSNFNPDEEISQIWQKSNLPKAVVEVVDPIALAAKLVSKDDDCCCCCCECNEHFLAIPDQICQCFQEELCTDDACKYVLVTLGLFTIVKIERSVQLLVKAVDFCVPSKECPAATENNPCDLFGNIRFPIDEFFPPQRSGFDSLDFDSGCNKCN